MGKRFVLIALLVILPVMAQAIDRRRDQFPTEPSYLLFPLPYSLPGIGEGFFLTGLAGNIAESHADVFAIVATGDVEGQFLGLEDIHIVSETLILNTFFQNITKAQVNNYSTRGMDSDPDDYKLVELSSVKTTGVTLTLTLFERQFEVFAGQSTQEVEVPYIRDQQGNIIAEFTPPYRSESVSTFVGASVDYTDDRQDPRKGIRTSLIRSEAPQDDPDEAEYFVRDFTLTGYIPIGKISTLVLHYFQSDANVTRQGNTDEEALRDELGFGCAATDQQCLDAEQEVINRFLPERRNGTSASLGGRSQLRSYPGGRFSGAHTVFYAAEFRWNLSEEVTPFDYFIWKDVRTGVQVAFFAETGSVGETRDEVGDTFASSYGAGVRLVSGSGYVYRADIATGDEGSESSFFFSYPF